MDFGALPPEINSVRMYSGPGSGSMLAAAGAWDILATELYSVASGYSSVIAGLVIKWQGPAAVAMAQAAAPYATWLSATGAQAEQAATQAQAAASAHAAAFAATVPPPLIIANRTLLMSLIATNILGQNSPAIAATEADYEEMWAQDATAMYGYAAASATASQLTPFTSPPATTDAAGLASQGAVVAEAAGAAAGTQTQEVMSSGSALVSTVPQALQGLASAPASTSLETTLESAASYMSHFNTFSAPTKYATYPMTFLNQALTASRGLASAPAAAAKAVESGLAGGVGASARAVEAVGLSALGSGAGDVALSAGVGRGLSIGALSVPPSWLTTPAGSLGAELSRGTWSAAPLSGSAGATPAGMPFMPIGNMAGRGMSGAAASRFELRSGVVPHTPAGG
ncbi:PPE family protein [Mycobacterium spongiae]|uniref:PPE domain-containing protein n=1 Tax=Mycobacterium spongiae TaxID=886343 RepID=A0A975PWR7_9MYCO|nr:PPE family protein [Mycobacterium spongiae]QUR66958.1 PPE domain-containing protein [Mycobacterium spongiae]